LSESTNLSENLMGTNPPLTDSEKHILAISNNVTSVASFIALIIFFVNISLQYSKRMNFPLKLICNLFFTDLIYSISNILSNFSGASKIVCTVEGITRNFGCWSTVVWATCIAYSAYSMTVENNIRINKKYRMMLFIGYVVPTLFALLPLLPISVEYRHNGAYCIPALTGDLAKFQDNTIILEFLLLLGWVWIGIAMTAYYYIRLFLYLRNLEFSYQVLEVKKVLIFPVMMFLAFIPVTLDDFALFPKYHFELVLSFTIILHGLGFFNVLAYGYQRMRSETQIQNNYKNGLNELEIGRPDTKYSDSSADSSFEYRARRNSSKTSEENLRVVLNENHFL